MDDDAVLRALADLKEQRLVRFVLPSHGRSVTRYRHVLDEVYSIEVPALALLGVLLLRGPQTPGELRARTERMVSFPSVGDVQEQLETLAAHSEGLVRLLPRRPGQKEDRWQQLLADQWADEVDAGATVPAAPSTSGSEPPVAGVDQAPPDDPGGLGIRGDDTPALRHDVEMLKAEVAALRGSLGELGDSLERLRRSLGE
jgi:hypothetical protein